MSGIAAVVPVKPIGDALGRLAAALAADERRALQEAMLTDVLGACAASDVDEILVVSNDPLASGLAVEAGARVIADATPPEGMNRAVARGLDAANRAGFGAALVLTADLPRITAAALDELISFGAGGRYVLFAASRDGTGTNAMLLRPPTAIPPELGPGSLARHLRRTAAEGLPSLTLSLPELALDIDTPDDLAAFLAIPGETRTHGVCARFGLGATPAAGTA